MTTTRPAKPPLLVRIRIRLRRHAEQLRRTGPRARPEKFVFIVTYGRTGSTVLQKLLNTMPGVYVAGENHGIVRGMFEAWRNAVVLRDRYGHGHQAVDDPWYGALAADPDAFAAGMRDVFIDTILKPPGAHRIIGFKEIRYLVPDLAEQLDFMARHFAPALFVFNRRAVAAVAKSGWWKDADHDKLTADVARFDTIAATFTAANPGSCVLLDYERWSTDPECLRPVHDLLGAPFDARTVADLLNVRLLHMQPRQPGLRGRPG
jgi:hypothetical protein